MEFTEQHTPADIVKIYPKASDLFKENNIDFCCGGDQPLHEQFAKKQVEGEAILKQLNADYEEWKNAGNEAKDWDAVPLDELVDHITYRHHNYLKEELPALGEFVTKVYRVHGTQHPHLKDLHRLYHEFKLEMEEHTIKEDNEVFPLIKKYVNEPSEELLQQIRKANRELEEEHDVTGNLLKEMREITNGFQVPAGACGSFRITYARLAELEENTFQHVHLENNILFKRL